MGCQLYRLSMNGLSRGVSELVVKCETVMTKRLISIVATTGDDNVRGRHQ